MVLLPARRRLKAQALLPPELPQLQVPVALAPLLQEPLRPKAPLLGLALLLEP